MISAQMKDDILNSIKDSKLFRYEDFLTKESGNEFKLSLELNTEYYFKIYPATKNSTARALSEANGVPNIVTVVCEYSPSEITKQELFVVDSSWDITSGIRKWLQAIEQEILVNPKIRELDKEIKKINETISKIEYESFNAFSEDEITEWEEKLQKLQNNIDERIAGLSNENKELKDELNKIKKEINLMKSSIHFIDHKAWMKSMAKKILIWSSNPSNRAMLAENVSDISKLIGIS